MTELYSLEVEELGEEALYVALRRSLLESCQDYESMHRADAVARAASIAIAFLEEKELDVNGRADRRGSGVSAARGLHACVQSRSACDTGGASNAELDAAVASSSAGGSAVGDSDGGDGISRSGATARGGVVTSPASQRASRVLHPGAGFSAERRSHAGPPLEVCQAANEASTQPIARRDRAEQLRQELLGAIYGVSVDRLPEVLDGTGGMAHGTQIDRDVDVKALERVLCSCVAEVERSTGAVVSSDPVEYFLSGSHKGSPMVAQKKSVTPVAKGIRVSIMALVFTIVSLTALLVYLSIAFAGSISHPVTHVDFRNEPEMPFPVLTFCPGFRGIPLFPLGGSRGMNPGNTLSDIPLLTVSNIESTVDGTLVEYPESVETYTEMVHFMSSSPHAVEQQRPSCPSGTPVLTRHGLTGELDKPVLEDCVSCLRVGARKPFRFREIEEGEHVLRVKLAFNRLFDFCVFPAQRVMHQRILETFADLLASKVEVLTNGGFLEDPDGVLGLDELSSYDMAQKRGLFLNFGAGSRVRGLTSADRRRLQVDLFCNALFLSGVWYPVANSSMAEIAFEWSDEIRFWRRKYDKSRSYWDVFAMSEEENDFLSKNASGASLQVRSSAWDVYAEDITEAISNVVQRSSHIGAVDQLLSARFRIRRRRGLNHRIEISAPAVVTSYVPQPKGLEELFQITTLEFAFDRYLTEEVRQEATYLTHQFLIDVANAVSLFLGVSVHSVLVAPVSLYIHARLARR